MKKQIDPTIKAHLIRSAFYVLLLLAVCVIPFALAQRNTNKRSVVTPSHQFSHASGITRNKKAPTVTTPCWYDFTVGTDTFVPGVDSQPINCDDCGADITLPFSVTLYGQSFTSAHVGSNGHCTFGTSNDTFTITCPPPFGLFGTTEVLAPYWVDQVTFNAGEGVFTTTTGTAPNRVFYIEWRSEYFGSSDSLNYEIALFENGTPPFEYIYNTINPASTGNDSQLVVGQKFDENCYTVFGCDTTGGGSPPVSSGQALIAIAAATPTPAPTPSCGNPGAWRFVAPYPEMLESAAICTDGTFAYGAGGVVGATGVVTTGFYRYDPVADSWTTLAPLPQAVFDASSAYAANVNKIYVFGGVASDLFTVLNTTYIYDVAGGSWTTGAPMPDFRWRPNVAYYAGNGEIYVIGGFDSSNIEQGQVWEYDPCANTWNTSRTPDPQPQGASATSIVCENMYLAGGSGPTFTGDTFHYRYDI